MSSGWKNSSHKSGSSRNGKGRSRNATCAHPNGQFDGSDITQHSLLIGQEFPNNLLLPALLQDWQIESHQKQQSQSNRKKGNLEKNRESNRKSDALAVLGNNGGGSGVTRFNLPPTPSSSHQVLSTTLPHLQAIDFKQRKKMPLTDATELSRGARPKKDSQTVSGQGTFFQSESELSPAKLTHNNSNKAKTFNTNQVVAKLVQIREYIKQVTTTMEALESIGDGAALEKLERLRKVRLDLLDNEHRLVDLLQRVSALQNAQVGEDDDHDSDVDSTRSINDNPEPSANCASDFSERSASEDEDAESADKSLRKRNELLAKVAESQEKLKALQEQQTLLMSLQHQAESRLQQARSFHDQLNAENIGSELIAEETNASQVLQRDLENIEHRLSLLQDIHDNRDKAESMSRSAKVASDRYDSCLDSERQQLQDKLNDLQHKKNQMDDLLAELCTLRDSRLQTSDSHVDSRASSNTKPISVTKEHLAVAQQTISAVDTSEKFRKLEEMKSWLRTLQDMVSSNNQNGSNPSVSNQKSREGITDVAAAANEPPRPPSDDVQTGLRKIGKNAKTNNLSREQQSNESISRLPLNQIMSTADQYRKESLAVEEVSDDEPELALENRTKKLQAAKVKLQKIQELLSAVQNAQQVGQFVNVEYAEHLLASIEQEENNEEGSNLLPPAKSTRASSHRRHSLQQSDDASSGQRVKYDDAVLKVAPKPSIGTGQQHRQPEGFAWNQQISKLHASTQELWSEMRHQTQLQEQLRQRRRELESLMQKDAGKNYLLNQDTQSENQSTSAKSEPVLTNMSIGATDGTSAATWGGSSIDNGTRDTMDGNESHEEPNDRIDDDYSSDEPLEAEAGNRVDLVHETAQPVKARNYVATSSRVDSEGVWGLALDSHRASIASTTGDATVGPSTTSVSSSNLKSIRQQQPERAQTHTLPDVPTQEERLLSDSAAGTSQLNGHLAPGANQLQHQMETAALVCQTILRDQLVLAGLMQQQSSVPNTVPVSNVHVSDVLQSHNNQMIQQQLLLGLSHCYHMLYIQQVEMQRLNQSLQIAANSGIPCQDSQFQHGRMRSRSCFSEEGGEYQNQPYHLDNPSVNRSSLATHLQPHPSGTAANQEAVSHAPETLTLNNQVAPGNRANNYWDNFRSYSRQNLLSSTSHHNKSNECPGGHCQGLPRTSVSGLVPHQNLKTAHLVFGQQQQHPLSNEEFQRIGETALGAGADAASAGARAAEFNMRFSHPLHRPLFETGVLHNSPKDKVNKDLSGLAVGSNVLKNRGNLSPNTSLLETQGNAGNNPLSTGTLNKIPIKTGLNDPNTYPRERNTQGERDPSANISHPVEESVYAEVTKLISQFNADPQCLIRLLRELQNLDTEQSVHNALRALHDATQSGSNLHDMAINSKYKRLLPYSGSSSRMVPAQGGVRPRRLSRGSSSSSTDEDDFRTRPMKIKKSGRYNQQPGSRSASDVIAPLSLSSGHSTLLPMDANLHLSPPGSVKIDQSAIGCDVQQHRKTAIGERKISSPAINSQLPNLLSPPGTRQENSSSEVVASAHGRENEASTSDAPSLRFNVQQLEKQMQSIMNAISSFLSSLSQQVCNAKLISAISSRILALLPSLLQNSGQEIVNVIPEQLGGVLDNILQKYNGKRLGENQDCLLQELSEVLFNELAFLQLMQTKDGNAAQIKPLKLLGLASQGSVAEDYCSGKIKLPSPLIAIGNSCGHNEATDADLVVMARRGDDEENDKSREDFCCDIPDVCAGRGAVGSIMSSMASNEQTTFRASPSQNLPPHLDVHSSLTLADLGLATAAEGQGGEGHYFDREVENEGEGLGDTQDLAEADQSQGYMEAGSALDDVQEEGNFQIWDLDRGLVNGAGGGAGIDRTEDDLHNDEESLGATGGSPAFNDQHNAKSGPELGLDEVPIKLRDGTASAGHQKSDKTKDGVYDNSTECAEHVEGNLPSAKKFIGSGSAGDGGEHGDVAGGKP